MQATYRVRLWLRARLCPLWIECKWTHLCAWAEIASWIGTPRMKHAAVCRCVEFLAWRKRIDDAMRRIADSQTVNLADPDEAEASELVFGKNNRFIRQGRKS